MQWPRGMEPEHSKDHARNEIKIDADPAKNLEDPVPCGVVADVVFQLRLAQI